MTKLHAEAEPRCSACSRAEMTARKENRAVLKQKFTQEQMNELLHCVLLAEYLPIHMAKANKSPPQCDVEAELEYSEEMGTLIENTRLRIYDIVPNFPRIQGGAIDAFYPKCLRTKERFVYFRW